MNREGLATQETTSSSMNHADHADQGEAEAAHPAATATATVPARLPKLFETDSGVILLSDVSSVQCYSDQRAGGSICQVTLRSGVTFFVAIQYSRGLIEAIKAHHADGSPVRRVEVSPTSVTS